MTANCQSVNLKEGWETRVYTRYEKNDAPLIEKTLYEWSKTPQGYTILYAQ